MYGIVARPHRVIAPCVPKGKLNEFQFIRSEVMRAFAVFSQRRYAIFDPCDFVRMHNYEASISKTCLNSIYVCGFSPPKGRSYDIDLCIHCIHCFRGHSGGRSRLRITCANIYDSILDDCILCGINAQRNVHKSHTMYNWYPPKTRYTFSPNACTTRNVGASLIACN